MSLVANIGRLLGASALILALSAAVVWPVWALATGERKLFNALTALAFLAVIVAGIVERRRRRRRAGPLPR